MKKLKTWFGLADAAYDAEYNREAIEKIGGIPLIDKNPRNTGKKFRKPFLLKVFRYLIEQTNSILECSVLKNKRTDVKGFEKKAVLVYAGIIGMQVIAIYGLLQGKQERLMCISQYR